MTILRVNPSTTKQNKTDNPVGHASQEKNIKLYKDSIKWLRTESWLKLCY